MGKIFKSLYSYCSIVLFISPIYLQADEIYLSNGQKAETTILDTSGCSVKISRNGKEVNIKKKLIKKVVWKSDTIDYSDYECQEKQKIKVVKYQDTLENISENEQVVNQNQDNLKEKIPLNQIPLVIETHFISIDLGFGWPYVPGIIRPLMVIDAVYTYKHNNIVGTGCGVSFWKILGEKKDWYETNIPIYLDFRLDPVGVRFAPLFAFNCGMSIVIPGANDTWETRVLFCAGGSIGIKIMPNKVSALVIKCTSNSVIPTPNNNFPLHHSLYISLGLSMPIF